MKCNQCPYNNSGSGNKTRPMIVHTQGNFLQLSFPITMKIVSVVDGQETDAVQDVLSSSAQVQVELVMGKKVFPFIPEMNGNRATITDYGNLPIGTYDIVIKMSEDGTNVRYKKRTLLRIVDTTEDGDQYENDELNVFTYFPVIYGKTTAIIIDDDDVTISEVGKFRGDDTPNDNYADIAASYGDSSIEVTDDEVTLTI